MKNETYDLIIIGGGPAGITAGIYAARARMKTLLIESISVMGQVMMTDRIENYPGVAEIPGFELIEKMKTQAQSFGLESRQDTVKNISRMNGECLLVETENCRCETTSVIVATGARPKKLGVPGEEKFIGKGISFCATCDGVFFRDKQILVIGGGDTAVEEALFLTKFGKKVTIVHRRDRLRAAKILQERAFEHEKIDFVLDSIVEEITGSAIVDGVVIKNVKNGKKLNFKCDGIFMFVGWTPNTDFLKNFIKLNENGGIITDEEMKTSERGIFAAGDCRKKLLRQVVTACGDGAVAAYSAGQFVDEVKGTVYK
ncbi:MAG: thioredoxin-disulfide reductase [Candidatus Omnitrophica bacterium]|nr:thioredoxin-disulfide reductase [Candidatus Omnitrophota bacterium]